MNIFGYGRRAGQRVLIVGEAKIRPSRKRVARFLQLAEEIGEQVGLPVVKVLVVYDVLPEVEAYIKAQDVLLFWSYQLAL